MLQITRTGFHYSGSSQDSQQLIQQFQTFNHIRLANFLEPQLLQQIDSRIAVSQWHEMVHEGIGVESCINDKGLTAIMNLLMNSVDLFRFLEKITGCETIRSFGGRLYRMIPNSGHHDSWHTDMGAFRLLALSINLGKEIYEGGVLQLCERKTGASFQEIPNTCFGDAILFRLASNLQHRVTDLSGTASKTAFAGWFQSHPDFRSELSSRSQKSNQLDQGMNGI